MTDKSFQRVGSISNAHVGNDFETAVAAMFTHDGVHLSRNFAVPVGAGNTRKNRQFDLGSDNPSIIVECKSHTWTTGGNIPSAKITVWNESMYYFYLAPKYFRKFLFVKRSYSAKRDITLAEYYIRNYGHLIPPSVEIWEYDEDNGSVKQAC